MQEIEYEDGTKKKEFFATLEEAMKDARQKAKKKPIRKLTITKTTVKERK